MTAWRGDLNDPPMPSKLSLENRSDETGKW
jgi:hypothetical protein